MIKFKAIREARAIREALKNPYKGKPERDLKRKLASFETQLADLIKKSRFRQRPEIEGEIQDMETKVQQVRAALGLREDVNEAKYNDNDLVHIAKANVRGNNNPKTDKIIGYSKAPKNPNKFPNPKSGANAIMRIGDAKKKGFMVESIDEAFSSFAVPIPLQTLDGKKIGGGKTPIIVKARTAREAIQKAAKQLGVDFKFLKTGKVVKEGLEESVTLDEAFKRIPGNMINGELPRAAKDLESVIKGLKAGNDFDEKAFNKVLTKLNDVKKSARSFMVSSEVPTKYQYRADPRYKK